MNPQYLLDQLKAQSEQIKELREVVQDQKEHLMLLSAQVQSVTQKLNYLSDKLID